ncbi:MAG TPA: hypothetical protein DCR93_22660 [Cytophagales bacterium]|nr:hypothetical protein [Cytophagales bacterium]
MVSNIAYAQKCSKSTFREYAQKSNEERDAGNHSTAIAAIQKAITCAEIRHDTIQLLYGLDHLTHLYQLVDDHDKVLFTSDLHLALLQHQGNISQLRKARQRRIQVYELIGQEEDALSEINKLIKEAIDLNDSLLLATAYRLGGSFHTRANRYVESTTYYDSAQAIYAQLRRRHESAITDYNLGISYFYTAAYEQSLTCFLKALSFCDSIRDDATVSQVYNMMGLLFEKQSYRDLALAYIQEGIANSPKNARVTAHLWNNLGNIHLQYEDYVLADSAYSLAIQEWQVMGDSTEVVRALLNKVQLAIANGSTVDTLLLKVDQWWPSVTPLWLQTERSLQLGHHLLKTNPVQAADYLTKAVDGFRAMDATERLWFTLSLQREAFLLLDDLRGYVVATQQYDSLQEVLFNKQQQGIIAEMEAKYKSEKKEQQLQYERSLNTRLVIFVILLTLVLIILLVLWRSNVRQKHQLATQKKVVEAQKREIHHRTMNYFSLIQSYYALRSDAEYPEDGNAPGQISMMLESLMDMYNRLNVQTSEKTLVPFGTYMEPVRRNFVETLRLSDAKVQMSGYHVTTYPDHLPYLGIIILELLTNSVKHAVPKGEELRLQVMCEELANSNIQLIIKDNGSVSSVDQGKDESFGLQMVYLLAETQLKGKIDWKYEEGLSWCLTFPNKL